MKAAMFFSPILPNSSMRVWPRSPVAPVIKILPMGYVGGAFATVVGIVFVLTDYLGEGKKTTWAKGNIWAIEAPFLIASVLMVISAIVLCCTIHENELEEKLAPEIEEGEKQAAIVDSVEHDDEKPMSKANKTMLFLILGAEFFWFMSDNGIGTFMLNYSRNYLGASSASNMIMTIIGGVGSVIGFAIGGYIAGRIGRKWTVTSGLILTLLGLVLWLVLEFAVGKGAWNEAKGYYDFPWYLYLIWGLKGFGMEFFAKVYCRAYQGTVRLLSNFLNFREPARIEGEGSLTKIPDALKQKGYRHPLIVADPAMSILNISTSRKKESASLKRLVSSSCQPV